MDFDKAKCRQLLLR